MKRIIKLIVCIVFIFLLSGCKRNEKNIKSITTTDIEAYIEEFSISNYEFLVTYDDNTSVNVKYALDMLSQKDQDKLQSIGTHEVIINYEDTQERVVITLTKNKVIDIVVNDIYESCVDNFDISKLTFKAIYNDGLEEQVNFDLEMFTDDISNSLINIGEYQLEFTYKGITRVMNLILDEFKPIKIELSNDSISCYLKEFEYNDIYFTVYYNDNTKEKVYFHKDYISDQDIINLGKAGTYDIVVDYFGVTATLHVALLPNETPIEDINKDVIVYCETIKENDYYISSFYLVANVDVASLQFSIKKSSSLENVEILNLNENTVIVEEEKYFNVSYVSSSNINNEKIKLFDLKFISNKQYRNFDVNYNSEIIACFINSNNEVEKISDVFVTLTR